MDPGFYADMSIADYLDDKLGDIPTLDGTLAKLMISACPAHVAYEHPRLTAYVAGEGYTKPATKAMDRGSVAHRLLLGRGKDFDILPYDSRRTKAAKEQVALATEAGKVAILADDYQRAAMMVTAARAQLATIDRHAFDSEYGYCELCVLGRDPVGAWTRALIDWYGDRHPGGLVLWDYKTTEGSAHPSSLRWHMNRQGWAFQAAFQERILRLLRPNLTGQLVFRFFVQETVPPFCCSVVEPAPDAMLIGHKMVAAAIGLWQRCLERDNWPGYPPAPQKIAVTPSIEASWLEREHDPELAEIISADPFLNQPVAARPREAPIDGREPPKPRRGRPPLSDEERSQRALKRVAEAQPSPRKLDL